MKYTPRIPEENVNVTPESPLREFFILLSGILGTIVLIYFLLGAVIDIIVPRISPELEQSIAPGFLNTFIESNSLYEDTEKLQALLDNLQEKCVKLPYKFKLHVTQSSQVNALALPGGNIVIFSELLKKIESENELAFVLFHEIGHFVHRDHLRGMGRALVFITISSLLLGPDNQLGNLLIQGLHLSEMKFSRNQETSADEFALKMLNCAYGNVNGSLNFFKKIATQKTPGIVGEFYLSHPESKKRIAHLKKYGKAHEFSFQGKLKPIRFSVNSEQ